MTSILLLFRKKAKKIREEFLFFSYSLANERDFLVPLHPLNNKEKVIWNQNWSFTIR